MYSRKAQEKYIGLESPFGSDYPFYVLVESSSFSEKEDNQAKLLNLIEHCGDYIQDGVIAKGSDQIKSLWRMREGKSIPIHLTKPLK